MYNNPVSTVGKRVSNIAGAYLGATSSRILKGLAACAPPSPRLSVVRWERLFVLAAERWGCFADGIGGVGNTSLRGAVGLMSVV